MYRSNISNISVIEFVLFGGSVGAVIFIHVTYGADGVQEILAQVCRGIYYAKYNCRRCAVGNCCHAWGKMILDERKKIVSDG